MTLPLANAAEGKGLSKLWARRKIADAEVARTLRADRRPRTPTRRILALALEHQLVTRLTSLVAVDKTPSRPDGAAAQAQPSCRSTCRPAGISTKVFGERPQLTPTPPTERRADAGDARAQLAPLKRPVASAGAEHDRACRRPRPMPS